MDEVLEGLRTALTKLRAGDPSSVDDAVGEVKHLHLKEVISRGVEVEEALVAIVDTAARRSMTTGAPAALEVHRRNLGAGAADGEQRRARDAAQAAAAARAIEAAARAMDIVAREADVVARATDVEVILEALRRAGDALAQVEAGHRHGAAAAVETLRTMAAARLIDIEVGWADRWRKDVHDAVRRCLPGCLPASRRAGDSTVLAALLLSDASARAMMRRAQDAGVTLVTGGLVAAVLNLGDHIDGRAEDAARSLTGSVSYSRMKATDIALAADYGDDRTGSRSVLAGYRGGWAGVDARFARSAAAGTVDGSAFHQFKGWGAQPRLAEIVFGEIYSDLGRGRRAGLSDLNEQALRRQEPLPAQDWRDEGTGIEFDVKSNVWFPSRSHSRGLRGFLVGTGCSDPGTELAGVVFTDGERTRKRQVSDLTWSFIGIADEDQAREAQGERALPFLFDLPSRFHFDLDRLDGQGERILELMAPGLLTLPAPGRPSHGRSTSLPWVCPTAREFIGTCGPPSRRPCSVCERMVLMLSRPSATSTRSPPGSATRSSPSGCPQSVVAAS